MSAEYHTTVTTPLSSL